MALDIEYDEARGNPPTTVCFLSISVNEDLYRSTRRVMPYEDPADGIYI